jgi:N-acyl-phosphatidylethanolamine-hydrolysing phospholipase D
LNGAANLRSTVGPKTQIVEMDWWEDREINVEGKGKVRVTCGTPRQALKIIVKC